MEPADIEQDKAPIAAFLGLRVLARGAGTAEAAMTPRPEFVQLSGRVHGGLVATLADQTAVYAALPGLPEGASMTSIEFKLNFLSAPSVDGAELVARAHVVRQGRRVVVCEADVLQEERLLARGLFTYLVLEGGA